MAVLGETVAPGQRILPGRGHGVVGRPARGRRQPPDRERRHPRVGAGVGAAALPRRLEDTARGQGGASPGWLAVGGSLERRPGCGRARTGARNLTSSWRAASRNSPACVLRLGAGAGGGLGVPGGTGRVSQDQELGSYVGRTVGGYVLVSELGGGGMARGACARARTTIRRWPSSSSDATLRHRSGQLGQHDSR